MGEYRSKSYGNGRMEIESYYSENHNNGYGKHNYDYSTNNNNNNNGVNFQDLRCYSASYATSTEVEQQQQSGGGAQMPKELKKAKSTKTAAWCFGDPEIQRKKRVASYKSYTVEGKVKRSFSKSFRWFKDKYTHMVHGW